MRPDINLSDLRYECPAVSRSAPTPSLKFYLLASFFLEQARKSQAHVATWTSIHPATFLRVVCFPAATHPPSRLTQVLPMGTVLRTSTNESSSGWYLEINPPGNNLKASFVFGRPPPSPLIQSWKEIWGAQIFSQTYETRWRRFNFVLAGRVAGKAPNKN